jgi:hypothetical protein
MMELLRATLDAQTAKEAVARLDGEPEDPDPGGV